MTFAQFIKILTPEEVDYWWNTIAPTTAPKEAVDNNWKYNLSKNNKSLPFKWVIRELAIYYNINNGTLDFGSNNETRDSFCKRFDFEIDEDLVFDQSEFSRLKSFIEKLDNNQKATFQEFVLYTHSFISETKIPPYKIRMASRNNEKEAMVILGMRATQAIGLSSKGFYVSFIVNEKINTNDFTQLNIFTEQFKGIDQKKLINFTISHWNEIPQEILNSNRSCFIEEYEMIKDTKLVVWNKGASTTNSALKNLIYNNSSINEFLKLDLAQIKNTTKLQPSSKTYKHIKNIPLNQILYGPPGTGKTYHTINKAIAIANPSFDLSQDRTIVKAEYDRLVNEGQIVFTTFHQSMTYEDFIEGIKPEIEENEEGAKSVVYEVKDGIFKTLCNNSTKTEQNINEDNFEESWSKLIELVKKQISDEKLLKIGSWEYSLSSKESLKYSSLNSPSQYSFTITKKNILDTYQNKQARPSGAFQKDMVDIVNYMKANFGLKDYQEGLQFISIAKNHVIIIDEINRGNVSQIFGELITLIEEDKRLGSDEALEVTLPYSKEKFGVPSNVYIIGTMNTADRSVEALDTALRRRFVFEEMSPQYNLDGLQQELYGFNVAEILKTINQRIEKLLDRDHQIGHAYFINKNDTTIIDSFYKNIIPLLQEYFFGDYGKIGLVLGVGFVRKLEQEALFANFEYLDYSQFEEKESYEIIDHRTNLTGFGKAIQRLMNR